MLLLPRFYFRTALASVIFCFGAYFAQAPMATALAQAPFGQLTPDGLTLQGSLSLPTQAIPGGGAASSSPTLPPLLPPSSNPSEPTPALGRPVMGGFILSGGLPDWAFRLGPIGYPTMNLKLVRANANRSGSVGFFCEKRSGDRKLALALPDGYVSPTSSQDIMVMVGNHGAKLATTATPPSTPGAPTLYDASGAAISDILKAMGDVDPSFITSAIIFDDLHGHRVAFGLTQPRGVAEISAKICQGWYDAHSQMLLPRDKNSTAENPSDVKNPPAITFGDIHTQEGAK